MVDFKYPTLADVVALHAIVMERTGYAPGPLRDEGALESAIMRPQMAAHYEEADLIRQAVLLMVGISQAQAFLDGNKRTAYVIGELFLRLNDYRIMPVSIEVAQQLELVAERTDSLAEATVRFEAWLREHVMPRNAK